MPAKSKAQQRFFGMVRAAQKGEMENPSSEVLDAADSISVKDAKKMAKTKHKGLPEVKEEKKGRHPRDQKELDRAQAYIKKNPDFGKKKKVEEELTGDMKTDLEKYRVPRGPGGNPIRMGDKVRSMKGDQPLGQLKVKYGADKVREYYKKNRPVDEGVSAKYKGKYYKLLPSKVREKMNGKGGLDGDYRKETGKVKDWVTDRLGITNTKRDGVKEEVKDLKEYSPNVTYQAKGGKKSGKLGKSSVYSLRDKDESKKDFRKSHVKDIKDGLLKKEELQVDEGRENAVIAKRILQNKTKCADCGSYAHVTGASNCPAKKDPEGLPEGVMDIVRKYNKKKPEKKAEKAQDAGSRLRRKVQRREYASKISGSEDNVPDELRDHKTWSEFKKYLAI